MHLIMAEYTVTSSAIHTYVLNKDILLKTIANLILKLVM
jgi:hypothetical protein